MATVNGVAPPTELETTREAAALAEQWRRLSRAATAVALLTSPAAFLWFWRHDGWAVWKAALVAAVLVIAFRGLVDLLFRRLIPWPSLFATDDSRVREEDVMNRRRAWTWRFAIRLAIVVLLVVTIAWLVAAPATVSWLGSFGWLAGNAKSLVKQPQLWLQVVFVFFLFISNFAIFLGPLLLMNISQVRGFEPGDAEWGVRLDDVRGQAEAKEEVRRVVTLWQSGEAFERAGGKRERGLLFLGPPGTGKTMLAKAIATGFNSPFVAIPGSGFAATFIGIDAIVVRYVARKAKRLARKWGGQCIVFIDEIDAVGSRRSQLQGGAPTMSPRFEEGFYGPWGAINPSGDLVVETAAWRNWMFEQRAPQRRSPYPPFVHKLGNLVNQGLPGMFGGGGQLALNQLLVVMDGIDNPPFFKRVFTRRFNTLLDALYIVPRRIGRLSLRLPPPRPRGDQIYFIGATNVPMETLDPALTRPGRMGRHVFFRTPTKDDRKDIFDLYLDKVGHDRDLDAPERRDEIARITNGYSPAMIDQICSMALTYAHHEGRPAFEWDDLLEAMTTIESGTAVGVKYVEHETRAVAIHEAGHAAAAHVYRKDLESSRLSIRMRGGSLGHHQAFEKEERFSRWQSEEMAALVHTLGAMAAEHVFYGETSNGVGGDLQSATNRAAWMVGAAGMAPVPIDVSKLKFADETPEQTRERVMKRFEQIGMKLMNRTRGSADFHADPIAAILRDQHKIRLAAQILGQAYVTAENFVAENKDPVEAIANALVERRELYGDDLVQLLETQNFREPELDYAKESTWPAL
jgi:ATP-dependent Zn protease